MLAEQMTLSSHTPKTRPLSILPQKMSPVMEPGEITFEFGFLALHSELMTFFDIFDPPVISNPDGFGLFSVISCLNDESSHQMYHHVGKCTCYSQILNETLGLPLSYENVQGFGFLKDEFRLLLAVQDWDPTCVFTSFP